MFQGSYGDLIVLLLQKALRVQYIAFSSLQPTFLSILYNLSPFLKNLTIQSVLAIVQLFIFYSSPTILLRNPDSFGPLKMVLDIMINILSHNYQSNTLLGYTLLNHSKKFVKLNESRLIDMTSMNGRIEEAKLANQDTDEDKKEEKLSQPVVQAWIPTDVWYDERKATLPINQLLKLLGYISSKMEQAYMVYEAMEKDILSLLQKTSLIGVQDDLPKFQFIQYATNPEIENWLSVYLWNIVYIKNADLKMFLQTRFRYFAKEQLQQENAVADLPEEKKEIEAKSQ